VGSFRLAPALIITGADSVHETWTTMYFNDILTTEHYWLLYISITITWLDKNAHIVVITRP